MSAERDKGHPEFEDVPAEEVEAEFEGADDQDRESYVVDEQCDAEEDEDAVDDQEREAASEPVAEEAIDYRPMLNGPYRAEGSSVMDADGQRVVISGYDSNRAASGPVIAVAVAEGLNRLK